MRENGACVQLLEEQSRKVEELWASVGRSYQRLEKTIHSGTAQLLRGQMDEELKRSEACNDSKAESKAHISPLIN